MVAVAGAKNKNQCRHRRVHHGDRVGVAVSLKCPGVNFKAAPQGVLAFDAYKVYTESFRTGPDDLAFYFSCFIVF